MPCHATLCHPALVRMSLSPRHYPALSKQHDSSSARGEGGPCGTGGGEAQEKGGPTFVLAATHFFADMHLVAPLHMFTTTAVLTRNARPHVRHCYTASQPIRPTRQPRTLESGITCTSPRTHATSLQFATVQDTPRCLLLPCHILLPCRSLATHAVRRSETHTVRAAGSDAAPAMVLSEGQ